MQQNQGQRVFHKSIGLLEERLGFKVKKAILLIETDFGDFQYMLRNDISTFQMILTYFQKKLNEVAFLRFGSSLVRCDRCLDGTGLVWLPSGQSETCPKCNGGGEMMVTIIMNGIENNTKKETKDATV